MELGKLVFQLLVPVAKGYVALAKAMLIKRARLMQANQMVDVPIYLGNGGLMGNDLTVEVGQRPLGCTFPIR